MPSTERAFVFEHLGLLLLIGAGVAWYCASRLFGAGLGSGRAHHRAAAFAFPVIGLVSALIWSNQPGAAVGVVLASSVACLSLVNGVVLLTSPSGRDYPARSIWAFVLPAGILVFLLGFRAQINWLHAAVLLVQGCAVLVLGAPVASPAMSRAPMRWYGPVMIVAAMVLVIVGAWVGAAACGLLTLRFNLHTDGMVASVLLAPALVLGMVGTGSMEAQQGRLPDVFTSHVIFVLINLCGVLPVMSIGWLLLHGTPIRMPLALWRVDAVMLIVLGLMSLLMSTGRWMPGRLEGAGLLLLYGAYLVMSRVANE